MELLIYPKQCVNMTFIDLQICMKLCIDLISMEITDLYEAMHRPKFHGITDLYEAMCRPDLHGYRHDVHAITDLYETMYRPKFHGIYFADLLSERVII